MEAVTEILNKESEGYVTDLVPYRCPKCGNRRRFPTLRELKHHFETEHAFKTACIKPVRPNIFKSDRSKTTKKEDKTKENRYIIKSEHIFSDTQDGNNRISPSANDTLNTENTSPLLQSYKDDAAILELELQMAKQNEMRNKTANLRALSGNTVNRDFRSTLDTLNQEVIKSRKHQWDIADALHQSHDMMNDLETAAENKCKEQRDIIHQLMNGMQAKEQELKVATKEQYNLRNEHERLYQETEDLFRRADSHNESLKQELRNRNDVLQHLNGELERIKSQSAHELQLKENELKTATERMNHLELERDQLIKETELILKRADADSEELRVALATKENKLSDVNAELDELRREKQAMLMRTLEFYKRTEEGNDLMMNIIRAKDQQLEEALDQLNKMKVVQAKLVEESQNLTDQADDYADRMRMMLQSKEQDVDDIVRQLEQLKADKQNLEEHASALNKRAESRVSDIEFLQEKVVNKEDELRTTRKQLNDLKSFLQNAAEKERTARAKLETFISELINRAERAESELRSIKSQSGSSLGRHDVPTGGIINQVSTTFETGITEDTTERQRLPQKFRPSKPIRRKGKYQHGEKLAHGIVDLGTESWQDTYKASADDRPKQTEMGHRIDMLTYKADNKLPKNSGESRVFYSNGSMIRVPEHRTVESAIDDIQNIDNICSYGTMTQTDTGDRIYENLPGQRLNVNPVQNSESVTLVHPLSLKADFHRNNNLNRARFSGETNSLPSVSRDQIYKHGITEPISNASYNHVISEPKINASYRLPVDVQYLNDQAYLDENYRRSRSQESFRNSRPVQISRSSSTMERYMRRMEDIPSPSQSRRIDRYRSYYLPRPPSRDSLEFRAPPYGLETSYSLNSLPRHYRYPSAINGEYINNHDQTLGLSQTNVRSYSGAYENENTSDQDFGPYRRWSMMQSYPNLHEQPSRLRFRQRAPTSTRARTNERGREGTSRKDIHMSHGRQYRTYSKGLNISQPSNGTIRLKDNGSEKRNERHLNGSYKESDQVQYEELDEDDEVFPDELYLIPKSASGELSPDLVTKERRRTKETKIPPETLKSGQKKRMQKEETEERSGGDFDKIMDTDGILWDDMDTLPDVSDSELDELEYRVSPSGSEAIATKKPTNAVFTNVKKNNTKVTKRNSSRNSTTNNKQETIKGKKSISSSDEDDVTFKDTAARESRSSKLPQDRTSKSLRNSLLLSHSSDSDVVPVKEHKGEFGTKRAVGKNVASPNPNCNKLNHTVTKPRVGRSRSSTGSGTNSKRFKPICVTNSGRSSPSEKDLTSGGKEIHRYMSRSPVKSIVLHGSANSPTDVLDGGTATLVTEYKRSSDDRLLADVKSKVSSLFEEKLKEISEKYSYKRTYNKKPEENDHKLKEISEKYRQKRKDILDGAGVRYDGGSPRTKFADYVESTKDKTLSLPKRTSSHSHSGSEYDLQPTLSDNVERNNKLDYNTSDSKYDNFDSHLNGHDLGTRKSNEMVSGQDSGSEPISIQPQKKVQDYENNKFSPPLNRHDLETVSQIDPSHTVHDAGRRESPVDMRQLIKNTEMNVGDRIKKYESEISLSGKNDVSGRSVAKLSVDNTNVTDKAGSLTSPAKKLQLSEPAATEAIATIIEHTPFISYLQNKDESEDDSDINILNENTTPIDSKPPVEIQVDTINEPVANEIITESQESKDVDHLTSSEHLEKEELKIDSTDSNEHLNTLGGTDTSTEGFSIFAEPIDDTSSVDGDSNTQSFIDRNQDNDTDIDLDTDTESQSRGFTRRRSEDTSANTKGMHADYSDVYRLKSSRNTMSSASSQASLEFLDHIPVSRREVVRRRRQALCYIFTFLDTNTLCRVAEVCREWKIVSRNPKLWTRVELRNNRISGKFLLQLAKRCTKLRCLVLEDLLPRNRHKNESVEEYSESTRCSLEFGLEQILKKSESTLTSLSIVNCGHMLSSKSLWAASCYSRMLTHATYLSDVDPINAEVMWALGSGCRDIRSFNVAPIYPCQKPGAFNTKCVQLIGKCFRDLEKLSIGGYDVDLSSLVFIVANCVDPDQTPSSAVYDLGLQYLLRPSCPNTLTKCCQRLEYLELNHMNILTKSVAKEVTDAGLKNIRDMQFINTPVEASAVEIFYGSCKYLKSIEVQLSVKDFGEGTNQPENMEMYKDQLDKLKTLSTKPGLGNILKLKIQQKCLTKKWSSFYD